MSLTRSIEALGRTITPVIFCLLASWSHGQFVVERSPWLDDESITEEPVEQRWSVTNLQTNEPLKAQFTVEGINPRKPVKLDIHQDTLLQLSPYRRYGRICVEPSYMLYADYIYADPDISSDTIQLAPIAVGLETALPGIEFMPGTEDLYFTSIPALEALLEFVQLHPTLAIAIVGHENQSTDRVDAEMKSRDRARAVFEYLVSSGIESYRLSVEGAGDQALIFPEPHTPEEAEANRRISVRVTNY